MVVPLIFFEEQRAAANHDRIVGWDMDGGERIYAVAVPVKLLTSVIDFFFPTHPPPTTSQISPS